MSALEPRRVAGLLLLLANACTSVPQGRAGVHRLEIQGAEEVSESDIEDKLATRESPRFLGLVSEFIYEPEVFNPYVLERDLARVERLYRARGFYAATVRAGRVSYIDDSHVRVVIHVREGEPTLIRELQVRGLEGLPEELVESIHATLDEHLEVGAPFDEEAYTRAEAAIREVLTDRGYAYAQVARSARVDLPGFFADVEFRVKHHEPATLGEVKIQGLGKIPEGPVRRALALEAGDPYSSSELLDAQQAALELGVFSSVNVRAEVVDPPPTPPVVPVDVELTQTELRTVRLGAGLQLDTLQTDAHLLAGWEHGNFLGGLRRLSLEARPGVVFYPTRLDNLTLPEEYLPELGLILSLRQPGFLEGRTIGVLRAEYNIYAVMNALTDGVNVLGYRETRASAGLERPFGRRLRLQPSQNLQTNTPFAFVGDLGELDSLVLSYTSLLFTVDFRDHFISPHEGFHLLLPFQAAGLGGDATDFRFRPELRLYVPLARTWTFAVRGAVGALFPFDYAAPETSGRDAQILFFRGFFAGGPSSNRGYPRRGIGPHGPLPFLYVDGINSCEQQQISLDECSVPLGGLATWELSAEFRVMLRGSVDLALFCDAADVARQKLELSFERPHLSCGPGLRYNTPVGPIRADVGVRIPGLQVLSGTPAEPEPPSIFGLPIAIALGLGEAF